MPLKMYPTKSSLFNAVSPAIVTIFTHVGVASGYIHTVSNGNLVLVTAAHSIMTKFLDEEEVDDNLDVLVRGAYLKGEKHPKDVQEKVVVLGISTNDDIALLTTVSGHFDEKRQLHLCFSKKQCRVGDPLVVIGTPLGIVEPQPSYGEIRDCSIFPELRNTEWTQEAPSIMGTAPATDGSSGSPMLDTNGGVWSIAQWRLSSASTFVGGIHPSFYKRIVERLLELNAENLKHPTLDLERVNFNANTRKGSTGIISEDVLAGSTLTRLREKYPLFTTSELSRFPKGRVVLEMVPVYDDDGVRVGALGAGLQPDDIIVEIGNPPEVVRVGDNSFNWLFTIYFRIVETIRAVVVRPLTMEQFEVVLIIGRFPGDRERVSVVQNYNLILDCECIICICSNADCTAGAAVPIGEDCFR